MEKKPIAMAASITMQLTPLAPLPELPPLVFGLDPPEMEGNKLVDTGPWGNGWLEFHVTFAVTAGWVRVPAVALAPVSRPAAIVSVTVTVLVMPEMTVVTLRVVVREAVVVLGAVAVPEVVDTGSAVMGEPAAVVTLASDPEDMD